MPLHMIKLCVGCDTVEELIEWRKVERAGERAAEMVEGGSLYRVFKGVILSRQRFLEIKTVGEGVNARCEALLDETVVRVAPTPRRAFQGWRYLEHKDAPPDLDIEAFGDVPEDLARRLREAGAW
jgi:hypothetical protein